MPIQMNSILPIKKLKLVSEGILFFITLLWGATFVIVKESLHDVSSMLFLTMRFGLASLILFCIMLFRRKKFEREALIPGIFLGILLFLIFFTQTIGLKYTTATNSGFITGSSVVMVPFFQILIQKRKPTRGPLIGSLLVFAGILCLSSGGNTIDVFLRGFGSNFNLGDALTLVCAVVCAVHIVYISHYSERFDNWNLLFIQILVVAFLSLITGFGFSGIKIESLHVDFTRYLIFGIIYTSVFTTLVTIGLQTKYQRNISPAQAGIIYSFEPIFAAIFAFFLLGEKISMFDFGGCVLIFTGLLVSMLLDPQIAQEVEMNG
jgi:drug/metabolite transporter (DMT)-like permease